MRTTMKDSFQGIETSGRPRTVERNTFEYVRPDGSIVTRFHMTDIIVRRPDGRVVLDSAGYRTKTTKERMERSGYRISAEKSVWYVSKDGKRCRYYDGMILPNAFDKPEPAAVRREDKLLAQIRRFGAELKTVPIPCKGDCWLCMAGTDSVDHLRNHLRENYFHGSLVLLAMRAAGFRDVGIRMVAFQMNDVRRVRSIVRRYMKTRLGVAR